MMGRDLLGLLIHSAVFDLGGAGGVGTAMLFLEEVVEQVGLGGTGMVHGLYFLGGVEAAVILDGRECGVHNQIQQHLLHSKHLTRFYRPDFIINPSRQFVSNILLVIQSAMKIFDLRPDGSFTLVGREYINIKQVSKMSFKAEFQIILQIHDFVNVDLPSQGLFRLRASIYQELKKAPNLQPTLLYGIPFQPSDHTRNATVNSHKILFPNEHDASFFYSKCGSVRFSDEKVTLDDFARFKLEVQSFPTLHSQNIYLQIDLLFVPSYHAATVKAFEGVQVATSKFRLESIEHGLLNYFEGQFAEDHESKFSFTVFACLANFKFGKYWPQGEGQRVLVIEEKGKSPSEPQRKKVSKQIGTKQVRRAEVQTFEQFFAWISQFYGNKISNPAEYFYNTYVKNLRYYFYLAQTKVNKKSVVDRPVILKVPTSFLELPNSEPSGERTQVSEIIFKKYMSSYEPGSITTTNIRLELNDIFMDIFEFLQEMEKEFLMNQLMYSCMRKEYTTYIKERYGERVFKSVVECGSQSTSSLENKNIAKKMREKQETTSTAYYPIEDLSFINKKTSLQFVFYQVCHPRDNRQNQQEKLQKIDSKKQGYDRGDPKQDEQDADGDGDQNKQDNLQQKPQQKPQDNLQQNAQQQEGSKKQEQVLMEADDMTQISNIAVQQNEQRSDMSEKGYGSDENCMSSQDNTVKGNILQALVESDHKIDSSPVLPELDYCQTNMLIVMCHGFQGSQYDMYMLMRNLKETLPLAKYLLSKANEGNTEGDIEAMGERLGKQVKAYIHHYLDPEKVIINFVGHSMGGVIARCSLRYLYQDFPDQFGFFCSLSSPHLGYLSGVDSMIKAGLWMIRKFKPVTSLSQLSMEDNKNLKNTLIYRLSQHGNLRRFRKIILVSSYEDSYVAWHSARVLKSQGNRKNAAVLLEEQMVENIVGDRPVHRLDVNFEVKTKNIDSFIGRTAHINLIVQESLFKIINATLPDLFDITKP